jgi:lipoyl(octanoyl) transferase
VAGNATRPRVLLLGCGILPAFLSSGESPMTTAAASFEIRAAARARAVRVRHLGRVEYQETWRAMREFTARRDAATADELWLLEHPPVYTLGIAGRAAHLPRVANGIPVVRCDRGGQITYHGPGQVVIYLLLDLRRRGLGVRALVRLMERAVIDLLASCGIAAEARAQAPGVYVGGAKIAALGLRVSNGCCYHGLAFNADMDLAPFSAIDPCGYPGLAVTQARDLGIALAPQALGEQLVQRLLAALAQTE